MIREQIAAILEKVRSWPEEDQAELVEIAREIEARRSGSYVLSDAEKAELDKRLADLEANPNDVRPWEEVRAELLARFK